MLITPAIASLPYCAAAPSRKISILAIEEAASAFKSVATDPVPTVPLTLTKEDLWRLFPLIKTNTWSGPRPLKEAGSTWSVPSDTVWVVEVNEGAT